VRRQAAEHFLQGLIRQRARHGAFARPSSEPGGGGARVTLLDQGMEERRALDLSRWATHPNADGLSLMTMQAHLELNSHRPNSARRV
jgi:hypothetical protein